jgi:hypothetical protein
LNQLLSRINSSWIIIVKSDAETGLTSRHIAIIMMVVYSTWRLLAQECVSHQRQVNDKLIYTAMLYIALALCSNLLLGIDWTWPKLSSVCTYSYLPSLTNWSGQASALSDPLQDIPTIFNARFTHCLMETVSTSETQVSLCQATQRSVLKDWLSSLKLFLCTRLKILRLSQFEMYSVFLKSRSSVESQEGLAAYQFCI